MAKAQKQIIAEALLDWYDRSHRELPWRVGPDDLAKGKQPDAYRVWLSEVMLQQTQVETVKPYFTKFLKLWPDVSSLAAASQDDVMKAWAGLGYYSRARNLKKCAEIVATKLGGRFPNTSKELMDLPGIGDYTAAAISAIAFNHVVPVIDGNVERVVSRLAAIATPLPKAKSEIKQIVAGSLSKDRPGDFAQAMMDLGATVCTPRNPACIVCPLREHCKVIRTGDPEHYPFKAPKRDKPLRRGAAFVAVRNDGAIYLRKRKEQGLLGGMTEVPTTNWTARIDGETGVSAAPFSASWVNIGSIRHVFTHFELELSVFRAETNDPVDELDGWWSSPSDLPEEALPTVMKKAIETAKSGATKRNKPARRQLA
ncbi:MAG: A/G-specific adenine glycosylase [Rhizobiaceae bacterium]